MYHVFTLNPKPKKSLYRKHLKGPSIPSLGTRAMDPLNLNPKPESLSPSP